MTTYPGPWIQAPDYEANGVEGILSASPYSDTIPYETHVGTEPQISPEFDPFTPADLVDPAMATGTAGKETPTDSVQTGYVRHDIRYAASGLSDYLRYQNVWRSWRVSGISPESQGVRYWAPVAPLIDVPPDAIGWEWADGSPAGDSAKSEVVRLVGEFQFGKTTDDSFSGLQYGPILLQPWWTAIATSSGRFLSDDGTVGTTSNDWLTAWDGNGDFFDARDNPTPEIVKVIDGPLVAAAGHEAEPVVVENIDLTSRLDDQSRIVLASTVSYRAPSSELERTGIVTPWSATGEDPFLMDDDTVEYGHNYVVIPRWTFRPPVFRWLYATPQITSAPPLRHTQRDDRHGPSPRNTPTRSRQAGHRNTGYL